MNGDAATNVCRLAVVPLSVACSPKHVVHQIERNASFV